MDKSRKSPDTRDRPPKKGFRGTAENAKTKICLRWQNGECRFGDRCNFAHGDSELRHLPPRDETPVGRGRGRGRGYDGYGDYPPGGRGRGGRGPGSKPIGNGRDHQAWVASGCPIPGTNGWTQYSTETGEKYYHNTDTNATQWETPADWKPV